MPRVQSKSQARLVEVLDERPTAPEFGPACSVVAMDLSSLMFLLGLFIGAMGGYMACALLSSDTRAQIQQRKSEDDNSDGPYMDQ